MANAVEVEILEFTPADEESLVKGRAVARIGPMIVRGMRLVARRDGSGLFASFPARKGEDGEWRDICFVEDRGTREALVQALIERHQATGSADAGAIDDDTPF